MAASIERVFGVIAALNWEMEVFASCPLRGKCLFETTGAGPSAASAGAKRAVARGATCLVSWGTAGALGLAAPGDIVLPDRVLGESLHPFDTDPEMVERLARGFEGIARVHRGALASVASPVTSVRAKQALAEASGAFAVDMESAAIAEIASGAGRALIVVRVIVDAANQAVPAAAVAAMDGPRTRPGRVLAGLLKSPADTGGMIALGLAARRARRTLRACASTLTEELNADGLE